MSFILSLCILFVLFRLFLCISLNTDLGCFFFFGGVSISSRFAWIPILLFKVKPFTTSCHSQIFYVHLNFLSNYCITSGQHWRASVKGIIQYILSILQQAINKLYEQDFIAVLLRTYFPSWFMSVMSIWHLLLYQILLSCQRNSITLTWVILDKFMLVVFYFLDECN